MSFFLVMEIASAECFSHKAQFYPRDGSELNYRYTGMGILRTFPHLRIFLPALPILRISADFRSFEISALSALLSEREKWGKKCLQSNPNRASESERNAEKLLTKNIPNRASALRTSEQWASCAVHSFILLTSGVLNGNNLVCGMHFLHRCYFLLEVAR